jgi:hypothetical protein
MRDKVRWWRKYGAGIMILGFIPIVLIAIFTSHRIIPIYTGIVSILIMTVPCGIPAVNKYWYFWYPRQLYFLVMGILNLFG